MALKQVLEAIDLLDSAIVTGQAAGELLTSHGWDGWTVERIEGPAGSTDFVTVTMPGTEGRLGGGAAPTIGILGRLGSIGARPEVVGMVSDADGAIVALATALKLAGMRAKGDALAGDVILTTHVSPRSPVSKAAIRGPVRMASAPVDAAEILRREARPEMEAVLSVDATKGNRVINQRGIAISPTVRQGYILRAADDLLDIMQNVTGTMPAVFPLATQDITPARELRHINSIMMPTTMTAAPVVGVALTAAVAVPGIATGANQPVDLDMAVRFCIEVAKAFGRGECRFYDPEEFDTLVRLYGPMAHLQTAGRR